MSTIKYLLSIFCSISAGIVVGTSIISFIVVLKIIPRIIQFTKIKKHYKLFEVMLVLGSLFSTIFYLLNINFKIGLSLLITFGLLKGIFVGMLAAALVEVLNVIPILTKKFNIVKYVKYVIISFSLGKVVGSLFYWLQKELW